MSVRLRVLEARFSSAVEERSPMLAAWEVSGTEMLAPTLGIVWASVTVGACVCVCECVLHVCICM